MKPHTNENNARTRDRGRAWTLDASHRVYSSALCNSPFPADRIHLSTSSIIPPSSSLPSFPQQFLVFATSPTQLRACNRPANFIYASHFVVQLNSRICAHKYSDVASLLDRKRKEIGGDRSPTIFKFTGKSERRHTYLLRAIRGYIYHVSKQFRGDHFSRGDFGERGGEGRASEEKSGGKRPSYWPAAQRRTDITLPSRTFDLTDGFCLSAPCQLSLLRPLCTDEPPIPIAPRHPRPFRLHLSSISTTRYSIMNFPFDAFCRDDQFLPRHGFRVLLIILCFTPPGNQTLLLSLFLQERGQS